MEEALESAPKPLPLPLPPLSTLEFNPFTLAAAVVTAIASIRIRANSAAALSPNESLSAASSMPLRANESRRNVRAHRVRDATMNSIGNAATASVLPLALALALALALVKALLVRLP